MTYDEYVNWITEIINTLDLAQNSESHGHCVRLVGVAVEELEDMRNALEHGDKKAEMPGSESSKKEKKNG